MLKLNTEIMGLGKNTFYLGKLGEVADTLVSAIRSLIGSSEEFSRWHALVKLLGAVIMSLFTLTALQLINKLQRRPFILCEQENLIFDRIHTIKKACLWLNTIHYRAFFVLLFIAFCTRLPKAKMTFSEIFYVYLVSVATFFVVTLLCVASYFTVALAEIVYLEIYDLYPTFCSILMYLLIIGATGYCIWELVNIVTARKGPQTILELFYAVGLIGSICGCIGLHLFKVTYRFNPHSFVLEIYEMIQRRLHEKSNCYMMKDAVEHVSRTYIFNPIRL